MPEKETLERARRDKREGKAPTTQAGEFIREEMHHIREGKHGARSAKQAIAIGLSKARRSGVDLPPPGKGEASEKTAKGKPTAVKYAADGSDVTPPLHFGGVPNQPVELALIVDDSDAPRAEPFVHWVIYKIPSNVTDLPEALSRDPELKNPPGAM